MSDSEFNPGAIAAMAKAIEAHSHDVEKARLEREQRQGCKRLYKGDSGFNPINLAHWIELCNGAMVPYVPIEQIASVSSDALIDSVEDDEEGLPRSMEVQKFYSDAWIEPGTVTHTNPIVLRWNFGAPAYVKYRLSKGFPEWSPAYMQIEIPSNDPRVFDILMEYPEPTIEVFKRPWMKAQIIDKYPHEYRAYVLNGELVGISNYYPQRDLSHTPETMKRVLEVKHLTERLIAQQQQVLNLPQPWADGLDKTLNHWTVDFMVLDGGSLVFLEGGPPHMAMGGAHPCCFELMDNKTGVALKLAQKDIIPIPD